MGRKELLIDLPLDELTTSSMRWTWARQKRAMTMQMVQRLVTDAIPASTTSDIAKLEGEELDARVSLEVINYLSYIYTNPITHNPLNISWVLTGVGTPYLPDIEITERDIDDIKTFRSGWDELRDTMMEAYRAALKGRPE